MRQYQLKKPVVALPQSKAAAPVHISTQPAVLATGDEGKESAYSQSTDSGSEPAVTEGG